MEPRYPSDIAPWHPHGQDFVLLDVRSPALYAQGHLPGAINLPHGKIIESKLKPWPKDTLFVTYCAGPHCNGAARGALRLANLNRPVKIMLADGFAFDVHLNAGHAYYASIVAGGQSRG